MEYLTFWKAIGSLALGGVLGLAVGVVAKEAKRLSLPPNKPLPHRGICPACGAQSLRRLRCRPAARFLVAITRRWPYGCTRCSWRSNFPIPKTRRPPVRVKPDPAMAAIIDGERIVKRERRLPRERQLAPARNDVAEVRAAVLQHLEALNAGNVDAKAKHAIAQATGFGIDNGPMANGERIAPATTFSGQFRDLRFRDLRINIHRDAAVATGYLVGTIVMPGGGTKPITGRSTWVHVRQNGAWKIAHSHMSPLKADTSDSLS